MILITNCGLLKFALLARSPHIIKMSKELPLNQLLLKGLLVEWPITSPLLPVGGAPCRGSGYTVLNSALQTLKGLGLRQP